MKPRLIAIFLILVLLPLSIISWLGIQVDRNQRQILHHKFDKLLKQRLADIDGDISNVIQTRERAFEQIVGEINLTTEGIRQAIRNQHMIRQMFILGTDGKLQHPPSMELRNAGEQAFVLRTEMIFRAGERFYHPKDPQTKGPKSNTSPKADQQGWYTFYLEDGVNFIFWKREPMGRIIGAEFDRPFLLSDIIGELPSTDETSKTSFDDRIQLVDTSGDPIYLWGAFEPEKDQPPSVVLELSPPLSALKLKYFASPKSMGDGIDRGGSLAILFTMVTLFLTIVAMAVYFFRESSREARDARQRVTFVNQVSHELKTPLTNIRMYAELLKDRLDEEDDKLQVYLNVIVSESQRLSRLIGNVLSFGQKQRNKLMIRRTAGRIDQTVAAIIDQFRPGFLSNGFEIAQKLSADSPSLFDADALGQIISNLLSNVEKYASQGKWVAIDLLRDNEKVLIQVRDRGPGVPLTHRKNIFKPFYRLSQNIADGVTGTGIGLSISRELARLHGGELDLIPSEQGALFELILVAPLAKGKGA